MNINFDKKTIEGIVTVGKFSTSEYIDLPIIVNCDEGKIVEIITKNNDEREFFLNSSHSKLVSLNLLDIDYEFEVDKKNSLMNYSSSDFFSKWKEVFNLNILNKIDFALDFDIPNSTNKLKV